MTTLWPLLRFHLASGVRITLRLLMPLVVVYTVLVSFFGKFLVRDLARILFPQPATGIATLLLVASLYGTAHQSSRLLTPGPRSWLRHLPSSRRQQRLATVAAIVVAALPVTFGLTALAVQASTLDGRSPGIGVVCVVAMSLAAAVAAETRAQRAPRTILALWLALAALACFAQLEVRAGVLGLALMAAAITELLTRPSALGAVHRAPTVAKPLRGGASAGALHWQILRRSCGLHLLSGWPIALFPVGAGLFFVLNNDLPLRYELLGLRLGAGLGVALTLLAVVSVLIERRPPWPWIRSLPDTSRRRVGRDTILLAALASAPALATAAAASRPMVLATSLPLAAALAVRGAGTVASAGADRTRGTGAFAGEALCAAATVSLLPWASLVLLLCLPWLLHRAALRDRRAPVLAFQELRAGRDPWAGADT